MADAITCTGCPARWTATGAAHCASCHRTFSSPRLFDAHRSTRGELGSCVDPVTLTVQTGARAGEPVMFFRDGMWRGPEMTDEQKLAAYGNRGATT